MREKILFKTIIFLLFLPLLQAIFDFVEIGKLGGYNVAANDVTLSKETWESGAYQDGKEKYLKENFGFANWAIRLDHQWAFWAYGQSRVNGLIIGKENYLYEIAYINTRNGVDFLGQDSIADLAKKAKAVQDTLRALGKAFFFVMAPNKADYYSEYLLDKHKRTDDAVLTNYNTFSQELKNKGINHLDVNAWFLAMKDTTSYPLYAKTGIHYTTYGATIVAQKIIAEIEQQMDKDLPDLSWNSVVWNDDLQGSDDDLEKALNLAVKIPNIKLPYPQVVINGNNKYKPRTITIGDSFYWQLVAMGMDNQVFSEGQFWYYNREVYPGPRVFLEINLDTEINKAEAIFIIITAPNLNKYLGTFIETLYKFYYDRNNLGSDYDKAIQQKMQEIKNNPEWLAAVGKKAQAQKIPLETMIYMDAKFVVDESKSE